MTCAVICDRLTYSWPDGTIALAGLDAAFGGGRTGLIGRNGSGKSTLLRLVAGHLTPTSGTVAVDGDVGYLAQSLPLATGATVAELLGIDRVRAALHVIEAGRATEVDFAEVGDDWDIEERALAHLNRFGVDLAPPAGCPWVSTGPLKNRRGRTASGASIGDRRAEGHGGHGGRAGAPGGVGDMEYPASSGEEGWSGEQKEPVGAAGSPLDRRVATLSGGETVLTALAGIALRRPAITLLDEPTNNLDRSARERLYRAVEHWPGVLIVVSHDTELLELVDQIAELRDGGLRTWGGNFCDYTEQLAVEQEAARRTVRAAEAEVRREKRQLAEAQIKLARRVRFGQKKYDTKREPRVIMNQRKREAQVSAGKHRILLEDRLTEAREGLDVAEDTMRDDPAIRIDLPHTEVPAGQDVLRLDTWTPGEGATRPPESTCGGRGTPPTVANGRLYLRGPERVAITGPNGSGKTTLLRAIVAAVGGDRPEPSGHTSPVRVAHVIDRVGYLPQRLDNLDEGLSVLDNLRVAAPSAGVQDLRAGLARFLLRGDRVEQRVADLSGGERFRVALARILLADEPPRLLILDEPTNNLDLESREQLVRALNVYRGALLVVGHDHAFLAQVGAGRRWVVERDRPPVEAEPVRTPLSG
ncbi:ABC-F family ATP-binding cassette domain-containing protein [Nocardiopsis sp. JB363]|uniref:ABC-F family ATP-binding cassette domain-containing protein n=1 Tax=Nocardiopsis sp. JB363 TaxID=1434837 RepID=UPI00097B128C|nr:ATP-binding cassette domain-containing protein [Nocardiopsis sp. JB363]SIO86067.1 Methionine ABC transporter ATP-binding protein [Nocardiopsis sp. JB363]